MKRLRLLIQYILPAILLFLAFFSRGVFLGLIIVLIATVAYTDGYGEGQGWWR